MLVRTLAFCTYQLIFQSYLEKPPKHKKKGWTLEDGARFELMQAWNKIFISFSFRHFSDMHKYPHTCKLTSSNDLCSALCTCMPWEAGFVQRITCFLSKKDFSIQEIRNIVGQIHWKVHTATKPSSFDSTTTKWFLNSTRRYRTQQYFKEFGNKFHMIYSTTYLLNTLTG